MTQKEANEPAKSCKRVVFTVGDFVFALNFRIEHSWMAVHCSSFLLKSAPKKEARKEISFIIYVVITLNLVIQRN